MLTSGDVVELDLGSPRGRESGLRRPVVVVTAQEILDESANGIHVVPADIDHSTLASPSISIGIPLRLGFHQIQDRADGLSFEILDGLVEDLQVLAEVRLVAAQFSGELLD